METPYVGTKFRVTAVFKVVSTSAITDTTPVIALVRQPSGTQNTYTTATTSVTVTKSTTGTYYVDVTPDDDGEYIIGVYSTGEVHAYNEVGVRVLPRKV